MDEHKEPRSLGVPARIQRMSDVLPQAVVTEGFMLGLIETAGSLSDLQTRKSRIESLTEVFYGIRVYMQALGISEDEVREKEKHALFTNGGFEEGWVRFTQRDSKLVRDKMHLKPQEKSEEQVVFRQVPRDEYLRRLDEKVVGKLTELKDERPREKRVEELADIYEVLNAILKYRDIGIQEILQRIDPLEIQRRKSRKIA